MNSSYRFSFRPIAFATLVFFIANIISPTLQSAFADSTTYYVDATSGNDANNGSLGSPWQTLARAQAENLLQGDTISLRCGDSWAENLFIDNSGSLSLPITFTSYSSGVACDGTNDPIVASVQTQGAEHVRVSRLKVNATSTGGAISLLGGGDVILSNMTVTNASGACVEISGGADISLSGASFSSCTYGLTGSSFSGQITNSRFTNLSETALSLSSDFGITVSQNTFSSLPKGAIVFGKNTQVLKNDISDVCNSSLSGCAAITSDPNISLSDSSSASVSENIIKTVGTGIVLGSYGISLSSLSGATVSYNTVQNAEEALHIENAKNLTISHNVFALSRTRGVHVMQTATGSVTNNVYSSNTIIQRNPDYPYIEMRDEIPGGSLGNLLSASSNNFYPLYKPNTSFVRSIKYGGYTYEYDRKTLSSFDPTVTKFEYFAFKPYTNTGTFATSNLLSNGDFDANTNLWTPSAQAGGAPTVSHNSTGSYSGGSATITPTGGIDRIWMTNDAMLSISEGQVYLVTGYAKSASGTINLRGFLHKSGDMSTLYSDRIAETYASSTGGTFSFYLSTITGATDAQFTLETSNPDVAYEIDAVSVRRMNSVTKNTDVSEVLVMSNTGATTLSQACPGGQYACPQHVDGLNTTVSFPVNISPYRSIVTVRNGGANQLLPPSCDLVPSSGSVPAGQSVTVTWTTTNSVVRDLSYQTYSGTQTQSNIAITGAVTYVPSNTAPATKNATCQVENDVTSYSRTISISVVNSPPTLFASDISLLEGGSVSATLSGIDNNPGDSIAQFQMFSTPSYGTITGFDDFFGTFTYTPTDPDFCGTDTFDFRAKDTFNSWADPMSQPVYITCVNDTPVAVDDTGSSYAGIGYDIDPTTNDTDIDNLYEAQIFSISGYTLPTNGSLSLAGNTFTYTANSGYSGSDSFQYRIMDQSGALSNTGTVTLSVTIQNTPPTAPNVNVSTNEDVSLTGTLTSTDAENNPITFSLDSAPTHGSASIDSSGAFLYTPNTNYNGADSFIYRASDQYESSTGVVSVTINPLPDSPVATTDNYSVNQDSTATLSVMTNDSDPDNSPITLTGYTLPTHGTLTVNGTGFSYSSSGYIGPDSFSYRLEDDTALLSNTVTVSLNIVSTNTAPVASDVFSSTNEDTAYVGTMSGSDAELSTLTYIVDTSTSNGTLSSTATGSFTYTPNANYFGSDQFTYHVSDGSLTSSSATVYITINSVNDVPTATPASFTASGNAPSSSGNVFTGILSGVDTETSILSFSLSTAPVHGVLTLSTTGSFSYVPAISYVGSDTFTFVVNDGTINSSGATVTINVVDPTVSTPPPPPPLPPSSGGGSSSASSSEGGGPGGGGGGGSAIAPTPPVTAIKDATGSTLTSAPVKLEEVDKNTSQDVPVRFVLFDPTGLLGQLLLANRVLSTAYAAAPDSHDSGDQTQITLSPILSEMISSLVNTEYDDIIGPLILRRKVHDILSQLEESEYKEEEYAAVVAAIKSLPSEEDSRMEAAKETNLRILDYQRTLYENTIYRDIANFLMGTSSPDEE